MLSFVSKSKLKTHKVNGRLFGVSLTLNAQRSSADLFDSIQIDTETEAKAAEVERKIKKQKITASKSNIGSSVQKIKEVCRQIRGMKVTQAIRQLEVNKRRVSEEILKTLRMAHNNAKYLNVPTENLIVSQCVIGRGTPTKRYQIHAKGRMGELYHPKSHLTIHLDQLDIMKGKKPAFRYQRQLIRKKIEAWKRGEIFDPVLEKAVQNE